MSLTKLTENLNVIQGLADKPTETSTQLKEKFDSAGNTIKGYLNNTLTSEIDSKLATDEQNILTNTQNISTNTQNISTNTQNISANTQDINEIKEKITPNIIKVGLNSDHTISTNGSVENLKTTNTVLSFGEKLSVDSNGAIIIGSGVSLIKVSGQAYLYTSPSTTGRKTLGIKINGNVKQVHNIHYSTQYMHNSLVSNFLDVNEGDVITMFVNGVQGDVIKNYTTGTFLNVEVIK